MIHHTSKSCCYVLIYVDDIIILGISTSDIDNLIKSLNVKFSLQDLGSLSYLLGIEVSYPENGGMFLSQSSYICEVLNRANMVDDNSIATPMINNTIPSAHTGEDFHDTYLYRSIVGAL